MAELLLINPRKRGARKARKAKRATSKRKHNPVSFRAVTRRAKPKANPARRRRGARRRRNPIAVHGIVSSLVPMLRDAAIGAAGSVAVDMAMGYVKPYLPAMLQPTPGKVGAYDALKAVVTVALCKALSRPTRGMSVKAAQGALTVQMDRAVRSILPATVQSQLAYSTAGLVTQGVARVRPNTMAAYTAPGKTPLLNAYTRPGSASPLLSSARIREQGAVR